MTASPGCKSVPTPPDEPTGEELWDQAIAALHAGDATGAAELFGQSLAKADDLDRRADAAVRLAAAGRVDLGGGLLAGRIEPDMVLLARAMAAFGRQPPPGKADNAFVIPDMAEAIGVAAASVELPNAAQPTKFTAAQLGELARTWQMWRRFDRLMASSETRPADDARATPVWLIQEGGSLLAAPGHYVVHPAAEGGASGVLAHMGSWSLAADGEMYDAAALADSGLRGPARLYLSERVGRTDRCQFVLAGELVGDGMVVTVCSSPPLLTALIDAMVDGVIAESRVTPRGQAEEAVIIRLATGLGRGEQLGREGGALVIVSPDTAGTDYADGGRWLADVVGYARHGQHAGVRGSDLPKR